MKQIFNQIKYGVILLALFYCCLDQIGVCSENYLTVEGALTWQSRNDQRIPGNGGTDFSLSALNSGPFANYRIYLGHLFGSHHEIRALYAPFSIQVNGKLSNAVTFLDSTFAAGVDTVGLYRFNSYRLTYTYHFDPVNDWYFSLGFSAKIRDAEVRLTQGALSQSKTNIGFVPLLNFRIKKSLGSDWVFRLDLDGLAAPQGRAFDVGVFIEHSLPVAGLSAYTGYRTIEGGANVAEVYNFAWIHSAVLGLRGEF